MLTRSGNQQFKVIIARDEDGYLVASVPALPGCHTQAKTLSELMVRVREAVRLCLAVTKTNARYRSRIAQFAYEPSFVGMELIEV